MQSNSVLGGIIQISVNLNVSNHDKRLYDLAFEYMNSDRVLDAITEFKRIIDEHDDPRKIGPVMTALLYFHELDEPAKALPFAEKATQLKPTSEGASVCLVHCLFKLGRQEELQSEIRRYVATGGKIDFYTTLFEENGLTVEDFT